MSIAGILKGRWYWESQGLEPEYNVSAAGWIQDGISEWLRKEPDYFIVGHFLPEGYSAYARLFHPASCLNESGENAPVRWSAIADQNHRVVHPAMQFDQIANLPESNDPNDYAKIGWSGTPCCEPYVGTLPSPEGRILAELLMKYTTTPHLCYFCLWDGYGLKDVPAYARQPLVKLDLCNHLLFRGPLQAELFQSDKLKHRATFRHQSPNVWWPADQAWLVATGIDYNTTLIGSSAACIERILNHPELEALPITLDARLDSGGDTINPPASRR